MFNKQGADAAIMALAVRDTFVQVCLMGQCPGSKPGVPGVEVDTTGRFTGTLSCL